MGANQSQAARAAAMNPRLQPGPFLAAYDNSILSALTTDRSGCLPALPHIPAYEMAKSPNAFSGQYSNQAPPTSRS